MPKVWRGFYESTAVSADFPATPPVVDASLYSFDHQLVALCYSNQSMGVVGCGAQPIVDHDCLGARLVVNHAEGVVPLYSTD